MRQGWLAGWLMWATPCPVAPVFIYGTPYGCVTSTYLMLGESCFSVQTFVVCCKKKVKSDSAYSDSLFFFFYSVSS
jgi:hypothetical protein